MCPRRVSVMDVDCDPSRSPVCLSVHTWEGTGSGGDREIARRANRHQLCSSAIHVARWSNSHRGTWEHRAGGY